MAINRNYHSLSLECTRFKESQYETCFEDFVERKGIIHCYFKLSQTSAFSCEKVSKNNSSNSLFCPVSAMLGESNFKTKQF